MSDAHRVARHRASLAHALRRVAGMQRFLVGVVLVLRRSVVAHVWPEAAAVEHGEGPPGAFELSRCALRRLELRVR